MWLTAGKHALQHCDGYTKEATRGDDAARCFPFSPFPLECGAPVQPELIYHDKSTGGKGGTLSWGCNSATECEKAFMRESA